MLKVISTDSGPLPVGPYSQAIVAGGLVFVAGQGPLDPAKSVVPRGIEAQSRQVLMNVRAILEAAHVSMSDAVKVTVHLADLGDYVKFNQVYAEFFAEPYPARTTVGSRLLDILVEVDVIAQRPRWRSWMTTIRNAHRSAVSPKRSALEGV